jgi:transposase
MVILSADDLEALKKLHKSEKVKRRADRIKLILLLNKGFSQKEAADLLLLDEDTVTTWKNKFLQRTDNISWLADDYKPYFGKLTTQHMSRIRQYCAQFKVAYKSEIRDFVAKSMTVNYCLSGVQKLLSRIGLSHQQMHRLPGKVDPDKQAVFVEKYTQQMEQLDDNQAIMFIDAVHPQHNSVPTKIWSAVGESRWINSNTGRERLNINGAYNPLTQDIIVRQDTTINGLSTIKLFQQITHYYQPFKQHVLVFSDNGRANKCKQVKEWLAQQNFIKLIYLPPYSPNLNFIERLWKFMKKTVINTKFYPTFKEFKQAINDFFENIDDYKTAIKSFIGLKFQIFEVAITE